MLADAYSDRPELVAAGLIALLQAARSAERDGSGNIIRVRCGPDPEREGRLGLRRPGRLTRARWRRYGRKYGVDYYDEMMKKNDRHVRHYGLDRPWRVASSEHPCYNSGQ